jgi:hypothetical protein
MNMLTAKRINRIKHSATTLYKDLRTQLWKCCAKKQDPVAVLDEAMPALLAVGVALAEHFGDITLTALESPEIRKIMFDDGGAK